MDDLISRQKAIDTEGLDVQIRCEMCRNPMHTDRGCDGHCKYDENLYERIMQILDERITPLPSVDPEPLQLAKDIARILENDLDMRVILKNAETEIVRCKDCKFRNEGYRRTTVKWLPCMEMMTGGNWFCGSAERREDAD